MRWPISELATCLIEDCAGRHSGTDLLTLSSSHFGRRAVIRRTAHSIASAGAGERQAGTENRILSWNLAAGSAFLSTILPQSSKTNGESVELSWQQGPLSTGAIGRFLRPNRCPRDFCTSSGCAGGCACALAQPRLAEVVHERASCSRPATTASG